MRSQPAVLGANRAVATAYVGCVRGGRRTRKRTRVQWQFPSYQILSGYEAEDEGGEGIGSEAGAGSCSRKVVMLAARPISSYITKGKRSQLTQITDYEQYIYTRYLTIVSHTVPPISSSRLNASTIVRRSRRKSKLRTLCAMVWGTIVRRRINNPTSIDRGGAYTQCLVIGTTIEDKISTIYSKGNLCFRDCGSAFSMK